MICIIYRRACFFFFSSRRRHTRSDRDWSSDVCSSDLVTPGDAWEAYWTKSQPGLTRLPSPRWEELSALRRTRGFDRQLRGDAGHARASAWRPERGGRAVSWRLVDRPGPQSPARHRKPLYRPGPAHAARRPAGDEDDVRPRLHQAAGAQSLDPVLRAPEKPPQAAAFAEAGRVEALRHADLGRQGLDRRARAAHGRPRRDAHGADRQAVERAARLAKSRKRPPQTGSEAPGRRATDQAARSRPRTARPAMSWRRRGSRATRRG